MKMKQNLYNKKYFDERDTLDLLIAESIALFMKNRNLQTVLDVGCGTGKLVKFLNDNNFSAAGCDLYNEALEIAKKINKKKEIVKANATKLPFRNESFDFVIGISVIEHLSKKDGILFLHEAKRILKPNGYIFLVTPNFNSPLRFLLKEKWFGFSDPTHKTFYTQQTLSKRLRENGFIQIQLWFQIPKNSIYNPIIKTPFPLKQFITYLFFSTPLTFVRDSFWIAGQKI